MNDIIRLGARDAAERIAAGTLTSEALVAACIERIQEREPVVGAWEYFDPEHALAQARARDREKPRGPLHGVPVGLKDIIDTADMPTTYGSPIYRDHRPTLDAPSVTQLKAAGAVIMGKLVTAEFATYTPGKTANPHNPAHTPGGSSSGSAAAVADFHVPLAMGTQTAGSIIRPASFNGIIGYKPTYDCFDYGGLHPLSRSLDTLGVFARGFADLPPVRSALARHAIKPVAAPAALPPSVGLCRTSSWEQGDPAMQAAFEVTADKLRQAGARVQEVTLPAMFAELVEAQTLVFAAEGARALDGEMRSHPDLLSQALVRLLEEGRRRTPAEELAAHRLADACRKHLAEVMQGLDVLLTPSALGEAPLGLGATGNPLFSRIWTFLHVPCVCYPVGVGPQGLPLGVQVVGGHGKDDSLISNAWWMERRSSYWVEPA
ncbi:MAG TPA: amidase [Rhodocyclaceae bacterium]|nr:amidase [Rhodocyclaceae bacterium]